MRALGLLDTQLALILVNATFVLPFRGRDPAPDLPRSAPGARGGGSRRRRNLPTRLRTGGSPPRGAQHRGDRAHLVRLLLERVPVRDHPLQRDSLTIPVHIAGSVDTRGVQFWFMAVRALIAMVPPVLIALLAQRYIVRGLTLGAVKG